MTLGITNKRTDIAPQKEVDKCLDVIKDAVTFVVRGRKYGLVALTFVAD